MTPRTSERSSTAPHHKQFLANALSPVGQPRPAAGGRWFEPNNFNALRSTDGEGVLPQRTWWRLVFSVCPPQIKKRCVHKNPSCGADAIRHLLQLVFSGKKTNEPTSRPVVGMPVGPFFYSCICTVAYLSHIMITKYSIPITLATKPFNTRSPDISHHPTTQVTRGSTAPAR